MTNTLTPNLPELKRLNMWVQEQDKLEPGARIWDQTHWAAPRTESPMCQTAYCIAGMAITRAGHALSAKQIVDPACGDPDCCLFWIHHLDGNRIGTDEIPRRAAEILGISSGTALDLFYYHNSAARIDKVIRNIFDIFGADYDSVEPAPDLEIEIKAAEAVRPQLLPNLTNA